MSFAGIIPWDLPLPIAALRRCWARGAYGDDVKPTGSPIRWSNIARRLFFLPTITGLRRGMGAIAICVVIFRDVTNFDPAQRKSKTNGIIGSEMAVSFCKNAPYCAR
ncbi:hypothetical protein CLM71_21080 [Serratia sp. MYb239]|uniref:hypothetical protein n=1 Tax=Serratia sp. Tan611 TaxID=2773264 RepID=UPI000CF66BFF|nr:hypothetical protein [Serratia sp. Tan611]AVJ19454.1 hypothetical protein CLM71_21080 [Serratia sp. MYb239]QPT15885.1 hypothetical protein I6G37_22720 [Serratia rubidaea]